MSDSSDKGEPAEARVVWLDGRQSSEQAVLRLAAEDNVAVVLRTLKPGDALAEGDSPLARITVTERIMKGEH